MAKTIGQRYLDAPIIDVRAVDYWKQLAVESERQAEKLYQQYQITLVTGQPYVNADAMFTDLDDGRFKVSVDNCDHPVWTLQQNVCFRIVHDILGHYPTRQPFSLVGEICAYYAQSRLVSPTARVALFTEIVGQTFAYHALGRFAEQKAVIL